MKWIKLESSDGKFYVCENCGRKPLEDDYYYEDGSWLRKVPVLTPYCPWCGEKLKEEETDETYY